MYPAPPDPTRSLVSPAASVFLSTLGGSKTDHRGKQAGTGTCPSRRQVLSNIHPHGWAKGFCSPSDSILWDCPLVAAPVLTLFLQTLDAILAPFLFFYFV